MAADANNAGLFIELDAILAVVIGGTSLAGGKFSLSGTLVGVLVITTLTLTVTVLGVSPRSRPCSRPSWSSPCACSRRRSGAALRARRRAAVPAAVEATV